MSHEPAKHGANKKGGDKQEIEWQRDTCHWRNEEKIERHLHFLRKRRLVLEKEDQAEENEDGQNQDLDVTHNTPPDGKMTIGKPFYGIS